MTAKGLVEVDPFKLEATWRLEAADVADTKNGEAILSPELQLWRYSLGLSVYPHGKNADCEGYSSLFIRVPVEAVLDIDMAGATRRFQVTQKILEDTKGGTQFRGWRQFCKVPDMTNPLEVRVRFDHIEGKDVKKLAEEAEALNPDNQCWDARVSKGGES